MTVDPLFASLLTELGTLAAAHHAGDVDNRGHVEAVKAVLRRHPTEAFAEMAAQAPAVDDNGWVKALHVEERFSVTTLQLPEGERIALHDHPQMTGVLLGLGGRARIHMFDMVDDRDDEVTLSTGPVHTVGAGDLAHLLPDEHNLHLLVGEEASFMLDVFTPPYRDEVPRRWFRFADDVEVRVDDAVGTKRRALVTEPQYASVGSIQLR